MKYEKLHAFNLVMGGLHAVQGAVILIIGQTAPRVINIEYFVFNPNTETLMSTTRTLFKVDIPLLVALFFFLSATAHLYVATLGRQRYEAGLKEHMNRYRWYEYSLSASLMIVLIAMLAGIFNFVALFGLFSLTAVMNLMGLMMEVHNHRAKKVNWLSYNIGALAGIIPWIAIGVALWASESSGSGQAVPTFVYAIFVSLFVFFSAFAVNMVLQYKKIGKWSDYLYGERAYIILSLLAKSALAWQIYAGILQPVG